MLTEVKVLTKLYVVWYNRTNNMATKTNNNRADRGSNRKAGNAPTESPADKKERLAKEYGIKPKTKQMIDLMNDNPKLSAAEAYIQTHSTVNRNTAKTGASKLLQKPSVIGYRDSAVGKAKRRIVSLIDSDNESIALKASESVIDRNEGKAIQKSESTSRTVEVKLDLTGVRIGSHYLPTQVQEG